jgi:hypothetical protein
VRHVAYINQCILQSIDLRGLRLEGGCGFDHAMVRREAVRYIVFDRGAKLLY